MSAIDPENLVNRVKELEAENRRLARETRRIKWIGVATVLGLTSIVGIGGAAFMEIPDHYAARRFLVVDPNTNKVRASLGIESSGNVALRLNDEDGKQHTTMFCNHNGEESSFELHDIDGRRKVHILCDRVSQKVWVNGHIFQ